MKFHEMSGTQSVWLVSMLGEASILTIFQNPEFSRMANGSNNPDLAGIWQTRSELRERVILLRYGQRPEFNESP